MLLRSFQSAPPHSAELSLQDYGGRENKHYRKDKNKKRKEDNNKE